MIRFAMREKEKEKEKEILKRYIKCSLIYLGSDSMIAVAVVWLEFRVSEYLSISPFSLYSFIY